MARGLGLEKNKRRGQRVAATPPRACVGIDLNGFAEVFPGRDHGIFAAAPNLRPAICRSKSSSGGASLQAYQARISATQFGLKP